MVIYNGEEATYHYDPAGNLIKVDYVDKTKKKTIVLEQYTYDNRMRVKTLESGKGKVEYTYDYEDRLIKQQTLEGTTKQLSEMTNSYADTATGMQITQRVVGNTNTAVVTTKYDTLGREKSINNNGDITTYTYDDLGNVETAIQSAGTTQYHKLEYEYDILGNIIKTNDIDMGDNNTNTSHASYNTAGRMLTSTDAMGNVTEYEYYKTNRVQKVTTPFTSATDKTFTSYEYDRVGNVTKQTVKSTSTKNIISLTWSLPSKLN